MVPWTHRRHGFKAALVVLALLSFWFTLRQLNLQSLRTPWYPYVSTIDIFDVEPFHPEAIQSTCSKKKWTPGLVFTCDKAGGGIGNIRNSVLNCVRYAIEAGGGLVLPRMRVRNNSDITKIWTEERIGMDYMFDTEHFISSLRQSCPELLYNTLDDIPNYISAQTKNPVPLLPEHLFEHIPKTGIEHPDEWRAKFDEWLTAHGHVNVNSLPKSPAIVGLERSYLQFPVYSDGADFALNFGRILRIRNDLHGLAIKTVESISKTYPLLDISKIDINNPIPPKGFFGVHLRTEIDAVAGWPPEDPWWHYGRFDVQSELYLNQVLNSNLSVIYIASGNVTEVSKFTANAQDQKGDRNLIVTTKFDHLSGDDLAYLKSLAWDQQALIDFLVMLIASQFAGIAHSSFAWNVALKRHIYSKMTGSDHLNGPQMLGDEYSQIYGNPGGYPEYAACMWP